jgi:hypothetical protein
VYSCTEHHTKYNIKINNEITRKAQLKTEKEKDLRGKDLKEEEKQRNCTREIN